MPRRTHLNNIVIFLVYNNTHVQPIIINTIQGGYRCVRIKTDYISKLGTTMAAITTLPVAFIIIGNYSKYLGINTTNKKTGQLQ